MNNTIFNFLNEVSKLSQNNQVQTLDFTKKEDVEKLEKAVKNLKTNEFFSSLFDTELFDGLLEKAHSIYNEAHKKKEPIRPSLSCPKNVKDNIYNMANEYVETMVAPYTKKINEQQWKDITDSLYEFGCWMYNK